MKRKLTAKALILPLLVAFLLLLPLLGAAVIGEHRYERHHPAYMRHMWLRLLGDEESEGQGDPDGEGNVPTASQQGSTLNVLVVGKDAAAGLTDVMMIASLNTADHSLELLQIPRDTYARYTDASYKKINGAYAKLGGAGLVTFLRENMGVPIDRYVCVDLAVLGELVDMMGGVRMNVPADMNYDDPTQNLHIHLEAGEQVLNGEQAQMFVRYRSGYAMADLGRMDAQKLFLAALAKQAKETLTTAQTVNLVCRCFGKIKTDMGLADCVTYAKQLRSVKVSALDMATLPGSSARENGQSGAWYYVLNRAATEQLLRDTVGLTGEFDVKGVFTDAQKKEFHEIYRASAQSCRVHRYTAEQALEGEVTIRRLS